MSKRSGQTVIDLTKLKPRFSNGEQIQVQGHRPVFSVCIPAYNARETIANSIDSVLSQTFQDFEIVVYDDCSSDGQWKLLEETYSSHPKVRLYRNKENLGSFRCRNNAISSSIGKYVLPLDADDVLTENALEVISGSFDENVDIVQFQTRCDLKEMERYLNMEDVHKFNSVYDLVVYSNESHKNHNLITKCFNGDKIRELICQFDPSLRINIMMDDEVTLVAMGCMTEFGQVKVIQDVLYEYCGSQSLAFNTYSQADLENDKNCLKIAAKFLSRLDSLSKRAKLLQGMIEGIICRQARDNVLFPDTFYDIQSDTLIEFVVQKFSGKFQDEINEVSTKYLGYLVKPVPKHEIKTIGIIYQTIAIGGVETFIVNVSNMLLNMGYKVVLLTNSIHEKVSIPGEVKIEHIERMLWNDTTTTTTRMKQVRNIIQKHGIDLIFSQEYWLTISLYDFLSANSVGCYFMMCFHNNPCFLFQKKYGNLNFDYTFNCYRYFDKVTTLSREHAQLFKEFGIDSTYVPNVVENSLVKIAKEKRTDFNNEIVWVGRFCEQKNPIDAIWAFYQVNKYGRNPKTKLNMIGYIESQEVYDKVVKLVQDLGLTDKVVFSGEKTNQEVIWRMKHARVLIYTSKFDGYPYLIAEAMACGIPIVAYEQCDLELFKYCKSIFQCSSMEQLKYALLKTYNQEHDFLVNISQEEKRCFLDIYNNDSIQKIYLDLFNHMGREGKHTSKTIFGSMLYRYILQAINEN